MSSDGGCLAARTQRLRRLRNPVAAPRQPGRGFDRFLRDPQFRWPLRIRTAGLLCLSPWAAVAHRSIGTTPGFSLLPLVLGSVAVGRCGFPAWIPFSSEPASRTDMDAIRAYITLWSIEFKAHQMSE